MNPFTVQGQLTSWSNKLLTKIGFGNIDTISPGKDQFSIRTKDGHKYVLTLTRIDKNEKI